MTVYIGMVASWITKTDKTNIAVAFTDIDSSCTAIVVECQCTVVQLLLTDNPY